MKSSYTLLLLLYTVIASAQSGSWHTFDKPNAYTSWISFDNTHHNNSWQIGKPQKKFFDSAYSLPNAIITDTINSYSVNDTSIFYMKVVSIDRSTNYLSRELQIHYRLDIDSGEIAKIEILADSGRRWVDVLKEASTYNIWVGLEENNKLVHYKNPSLKHSKGKEWIRLHIDMQYWVAHSSDIHTQHQTNYPYKIAFDTTWFRFTFISDSTQTNKDGWVIDNIGIQVQEVGIKNISLKGDLISIHPNPACKYIYIKRNTATITKETVSIYNSYGQKVLYTNSISTSGYLKLNLPPGIYTLRYSNDKAYAAKQLVIQ